MTQHNMQPSQAATNTGNQSRPPPRHIACLAIAAGGTNFFAFQGFAKEFYRRNLRPTRIRTVSAGGPTGLGIAADQDPDRAVQIMIDLIHRRFDGKLLLKSLVCPEWQQWFWNGGLIDLIQRPFDASLRLQSLLYSDWQRWYLSCGTNWSPREAYIEFCEALGLSQWPQNVEFEVQACAVKVPKEQQVNPWTLGRFPMRPLYFDRNSGVSLVDALTMSGSAPGLAVPEVINSPEHGRELVVDGAVWNYIPRLDRPSIVIKANKITDVGVHIPTGIAAFNPKSWEKFRENSSLLFKYPLDYWYQWLEVYAPVAADRRHVDTQEHLVLAFGDEKEGRKAPRPAGLNTGAADSVYLKMYEDAQKLAARVLDEAEANGTLGKYLED